MAVDFSSLFCEVQVTTVFAQSPGPRQLIPGPNHGMNWLQIPNFAKHTAIDDMKSGNVERDNGTGLQALLQQSGGAPLATNFSLRAAAENGDGTVPIRSGRILENKVKTCVAYGGVDHEGAYKKNPQRIFALWAITKIAYEVRNTSMAYEL
jgi:hypothetical protein